MTVETDTGTNTWIFKPDETRRDTRLMIAELVYIDPIRSTTVARFAADAVARLETRSF